MIVMVVVLCICLFLLCFCCDGGGCGVLLCFCCHGGVFFLKDSNIFILTSMYKHRNICQ